MGLTSNLGKLSNMITSTGSAVGIGTNSPQSGYILDVKGFSQFGNSIYPNVIRLGDQDTNSTIIQSVSTAGVAKDLTFWNTSERMRIDSLGNVGIGTSSPSTKFQIYVGALANNGYDGMRIADDVAHYWFLARKDASGNRRFAIYNGQNTYPITLQEGGGNVGIGTTSPSYTLDVTGTGTFRAANGVNIIGPTGNPAYLTTDQSVNNGGKRWRIGHTGAASGWSSFDIYNQTDNILGMTITSTGNVGIGTTSPTNLLAVGTSSANQGIVLMTNSNGATNSRWGIVDPGVNNTAYIGTIANNDFALYSYNTERMRIFANGNVAVGISTDTTFKFTAEGEILSNGIYAALFVQARDLSTRYAWYATGSTYLNFYNTGSGITGQFTRTSGAYTALSDVNKKKDFEQSEIGLNAILGLKPTLFRMKDDDEKTEKQLGFIAQEVKEFIPQAYVENGDFIGLQDRPIIAALVKSIQELESRIKILENK